MYYEVSEAIIKKEKALARDLRHSRWWKNKLQNAVCYYCQTGLGPDEATMDHVIPLTRGGKSTKANVVVACKPCNTSKKDRLFEIF
jgi:5-methylcytosine-specific restriction endonuclease McrA